MSDKRYEANIIRATAVEPANNIETTSASGVWSLDEVMELQKKNKWPTAGNVTTDVDAVFSTFVYDGNGSTGQSIVNGIDLSGEGGLVWFKQRNATRDQGLFDTVRGVNKYLISNDTNAEATSSTMLTGFNSNGFTLGGGGAIVNNGSGTYVSWTFRKAPKFCDVVTYSGNGATRTISHNLGSDVGMLIVKRTDASAPWAVWHRQLNGGTNSGQYYLQLNSTNAEAASSPYWNNTAPTSTEFTVSSDGHVNNASGTYVAYLFAHNDGDGDFGPDGDADIIKCGSFSGSSSSDVTVNVGFEPQWLLTRRTGGGNWTITDNMRGLVTGGIDNTLFADTSGAENTAADRIDLTSTGFIQKSGQTGNETVIYMAIRRGPLAEPTSATDVFAMDSNGLSANSEGVYFTSNFPVDFTINKERTHTSDPWIVMSRLQGDGNYLDSTGSGAETSGISNGKFDRMTGWMNSGSAMMSWMWKRAPNFFDVVCHVGDGTADRAISHNLGQIPRLRITKSRDSTTYSSWWVYYIDSGGTQTRATLSQSPFYANTDVVSTATNIYPDVSVTNASGIDYVHFLFGEISGISKISTYTGNGGASAINVDCGFSSGARFVLIKSKTESTNWIVYDSVRGIVSGNDPYVLLNTTAAEVTNTDYIDPLSSGFTVSTSAPTSGLVSLNANNVEYVFYAIA